MLVDHVIESPIIGLLESALMSFDIYNDAAQQALVILKQRFLYDEIEAEVTKRYIRILILLIQGNPWGHSLSTFQTSHMYMQSLYSADSYAVNNILNSILWNKELYYFEFQALLSPWRYPHVKLKMRLV